MHFAMTVVGVISPLHSLKWSHVPR